jgi:hypothetical protein
MLLDDVVVGTGRCIDKDVAGDVGWCRNEVLLPLDDSELLRGFKAFTEVEWIGVGVNMVALIGLLLTTLLGGPGFIIAGRCR